MLIASASRNGTLKQSVGAADPPALDDTDDAGSEWEGFDAEQDQPDPASPAPARKVAEDSEPRSKKQKKRKAKQDHPSGRTKPSSNEFEGLEESDDDGADGRFHPYHPRSRCD